VRKYEKLKIITGTAVTTQNWIAQRVKLKFYILSPTSSNFKWRYNSVLVSHIASLPCDNKVCVLPTHSIRKPLKGFDDMGSDVFIAGKIHILVF
jgi:hypothetical protein